MSFIQTQATLRTRGLLCLLDLVTNLSWIAQDCPGLALKAPCPRQTGTLGCPTLVAPSPGHGFFYTQGFHGLRAGNVAGGALGKGEGRKESQVF